MHTSRNLLVVVTGLALLALLATPLAAALDTRSLACDFGASPDWLETIVNVKHLVAFSVLATTSFVGFGASRGWIAALFVLTIATAIEVEEAWFDNGHCRARDLIPGLLAIAAGYLAALAIRRRTKTPKPSPSSAPS